MGRAGQEVRTSQLHGDGEVRDNGPSDCARLRRAARIAVFEDHFT